MKGLAWLFAFAAWMAAPPTPWQYHLDTVISKVEVIRAGTVRRATVGEILSSGDELRTGWRGRTTVSVPAKGTRFDISPASHVRLGGEEPGVIVYVQHGTLRAIFDHLTGREDRIVATPGALLAVRGTRYGLVVHPDGEASLAVFAGAVDVIPRDPALHATTVTQGTLCRFGPRRAPAQSPLPPNLDERAWENHRAMRPQGEPGARERAPGPPATPRSTSRRVGERGRG